MGLKGRIITEATQVRGVSSLVVFIGWLAAGAALVAQQLLDPSTAGSQMGLLTNGGDLDIYRHGGLQLLYGRPPYAAELPAGG